MIPYARLWATMKRRGATTYTLRNEGEDENFTGSTMLRLQHNPPVSTNT